MENHSKQITKVLEYLRDNDGSEDVHRGAMIMRIKLSIEEDYLNKILELLLAAKSIEICSQIGSLEFQLPELDSEIYTYYRISEKGKKQLLRGTWEKRFKEPKAPKQKIHLTKEQKLELRKTRRENIQHWWLLLTIIGATIGAAIWALDYFFDFNVWKFIKSRI